MTLRYVSFLVVVVVAAACTYAVPPGSPPLPAFESVVIVSDGPTGELKARFGVTSDNSSTGTGAGVGAGAGAVAGAGAAFACGPFVILCATLTVPTGALVGVIGGSLAGAAVDSQKKPSEDDLLTLDTMFVELAQQRTIHEEIRESLLKMLPANRQVSVKQADAVLKLNLSDVRFVQNADGEYALTLKSILNAEWNRDMRHIRNGKRMYEYASRPLPLEDWIADQGRTLNLAFDACVNGLAEQMADDISFTKIPGSGAVNSAPGFVF